MFIRYIRNGRSEIHMATRRTLMFLLAWAKEGEEIIVLEYVAAPTQAQLDAQVAS